CLDVFRLMELTPQQIHDELALEPGAEVVAYCHGGSRSAMAVQILRALGYEARNYVGSWHEWSRHDDLPLET
ncbi:MAG TPA: rhodanese-like domain-containing protein, partial [Gaiellaceae bacterium]|nr:rhodanese-like domain-containing protein [Gaiellaceae bacterium]